MALTRIVPAIKYRCWIAISTIAIRLVAATAAAAAAAPPAPSLAGAPDPPPGESVARSEMVVTDEQRGHWSYLPLSRPTPASITDSSFVRTPVDQFVLAALEANKLSPSPQVGARKLARRIYFDLIGLPPTPAQVEWFLDAHAIDSRSAAASLVDQLLESPHYGERWARHWLDVVRYADSDGQESDADRPTAHHYRDFIIRALNDDMRFDTFARWQLAGDELEPDNPLAIAATGFIVAGPHTVLDVPMEEEKIRNRFNELDDMIATTGSAMFGLTLACARCHDHKYDPLPRRDYYRLLSAFNSGDRAQVPLAPLDDVRRYRKSHAAWETEFDLAKLKLDDWRRETRRPHEKATRHAKIDALKASDDEKAVLRDRPDSPEAKKIASRFSPKELKLDNEDYKPFLSEEKRREWDVRELALKEVEACKPAPLPTAFAFADFGPKPRENWLLARGDFRARGEPVELGFLTVLTRGRPASDFWSAARADQRRDDSTQQRRALSQWMVDVEQGAGALVARVIVNRVWQHHFGDGLVRTPNDFGVRGERPTHPELLEWLTHEFVDGGWKLKPLHRLIMTSSVYLQDTAFDRAKAKVDPDHRLLWRRRPQRIESEILRDSLLAVSGKLNSEMYGPAVKAPIAAEAIQARNVKNPYPKDLKETPSSHRRAVYLFHKRVVQHPLMQAFDGPDAQASCGRRENTTVAPQALALLNDPFVRSRAEDLARRLAAEASGEAQAQLRLAWRLALAREPSSGELEAGTAFVDGQVRRRAAREPDTPEPDARHLALADLCQMIFAMNEFIYVD